MTGRRMLIALIVCLILLPSSTALAGDVATALEQPDPGINPLALELLFRHRELRQPSYAEHLAAQLEAQSGYTTSPLAEQYRHNLEVERSLQGIERGVNRPYRGSSGMGAIPGIPGIGGIGE